MGTTLVVVGAIQGSNHDERRNWREPRSPAVIFRSDKRLPAGAVWLTIEILHSRQHSRRLTLILAGWLFPRDRSTTSFFFLPFFIFFFSSLFLSQSVTDLAAVQLWHLSRWGYEYAISRSRFVSRVTVPARFALVCSSYKRIDVHYPTTKITPEEIDSPTREITPMLLRRLMHSWLLRYTSFTRGHAIAVCLTARSRCALRGARPDWSLITIN